MKENNDISNQKKNNSNLIKLLLIILLIIQVGVIVYFLFLHNYFVENCHDNNISIYEGDE